jgi:hypothetical protein
VVAALLDTSIVAHRLQQPLYTRNLKHFKPLLAALTVTPY